MEWFDKIIRDLDTKDSIDSTDEFRKIYESMTDTKHAYMIPERIIHAAFVHDKMIIDEMKKVCDEGIGQMFQYIMDHHGHEEASYLSFNVSSLVDLLLERQTSYALVFKAAMEAKDRGQDKGKET